MHLKSGVGIIVPTGNLVQRNLTDEAWSYSLIGLRKNLYDISKKSANSTFLSLRVFLKIIIKHLEADRMRSSSYRLCSTFV